MKSKVLVDTQIRIYANYLDTASNNRTAAAILDKLWEESS